MIALMFAYVISTAAHITVGEQVPKMFAIANAETVARRVAGPLEVFTRVFSPAIAALDNVSNAMLRRRAPTAAPPPSMAPARKPQAADRRVACRRRLGW